VDRSGTMANSGETMKEDEGIRVRQTHAADVPAISIILREERPEITNFVLPLS
jgi:hypothetical protein